MHVSAPALTARTPQSAPSPQYGNYNTKIKAWQHSGESPYVHTSTATSGQSRRQPKQQQRQDQWDTRSQDNWGQPRDLRHHEQARYDSWSRHSDAQHRPTSWQSDSYDANTYREEIDYNYVPVDYKFSPSEYPNLAYMQPIIPGTDL